MSYWEPADLGLTGLREGRDKQYEEILAAERREKKHRAKGSQAETLLAVQLEQAGIPFEREAKVWPGRKYRADFLVYAPLGRPALIVEVEGGIGGISRHATYTGFTADCKKYNLAAELGFPVLRYTSRMVNEGEAIEQIRRILSKKEERAA